MSRMANRFLPLLLYFMFRWSVQSRGRATSSSMETCFPLTRLPGPGVSEFIPSPLSLLKPVLTRRPVTLSWRHKLYIWVFTSLNRHKKVGKVSNQEIWFHITLIYYSLKNEMYLDLPWQYCGGLKNHQNGLMKPLWRHFWPSLMKEKKSSILTRPSV